MSDVWANYTTGSEKVIVSVVDEGVDLNHPDLAWNCLESGHYNAVDGNQVIYAGNHGTHVAGTVAAVNNNGKGVCGVAGGDFKAGSKGVRIMSCQIFKEVNGETRAEIPLLPSSGVLIMVLSSARTAGVTAMIKMVTVNSQVTNIRLQ